MTTNTKTTYPTLEEVQQAILTLHQFRANPEVGEVLKNGEMRGFLLVSDIDLDDEDRKNGLLTLAAGADHELLASAAVRLFQSLPPIYQFPVFLNLKNILRSSPYGDPLANLDPQRGDDDAHDE